MDMVKIRRVDNGARSGVLLLTIPSRISRDLPDGTTHMTCEATDEGILYRPVVTRVQGMKEKP
jgi:hypothetical protein